MPEKYVKKPVTIEAQQWNGDTANLVEPMYLSTNPKERNTPMIMTLEGPLKVSKGDFIIKGIKGEFYPCKPDIFEATYGKLEDLPNETALLGLATTRELLEEIKVRIEIDGKLDYRTVDSY